MPAPEPGVRLGVAKREQLEFHGDQNQAAILGQPGIVRPQGRQLGLGVSVPPKVIGNGLDSLLGPFLEQCKEDIFLALEVRIESAAGVAGPGGDVFQARSFKTVLCENALGCI